MNDKKKKQNVEEKPAPTNEEMWKRTDNLKPIILTRGILQGQ